MHRPLILSLFPGIDLLGKAFEAAGYCVVRGPDPLFGSDIRDFNAPAGFFVGIIAGPPCQDFSSARRTAPTGEGLELLAHTQRIIAETQPAWALIENVPRVPEIRVDGYVTQRIDINGGECSLRQRRNRHFQFLHGGLFPLSVPRAVTHQPTEPAATASEARRQHRRTWQEFCRCKASPSHSPCPISRSTHATPPSETACPCRWAPLSPKRSKPGQSHQHPPTMPVRFARLFSGNQRSLQWHAGNESADAAAPTHTSTTSPTQESSDAQQMA